MLLEQTIAAIVNGDGRSFADSGELLRRRTAKFASLRDPLHDSTHLDDLQNEAVLLEYTKDSGMVSYDGGLPNSGEIFRDSVKNKEGLREIEEEEMKQWFTAELRTLL
jgi:hypothetical protein